MNSLAAAVDVSRSFIGVITAISAAKSAAAVANTTTASFLDELAETLAHQIERVEEAASRFESAIDAATPDPDQSRITLRRLATLERMAVMLRSWAERRCWEDDEGAAAIVAASEQRVIGLKRVVAWSGRVVEKRILRIRKESGSGAGFEPVSRDLFSLWSLEEEIREIENGGPRSEVENSKEFQEMLNLMKGLFLGT